MVLKVSYADTKTVLFSQNVLCSTYLWCYNLITMAEKLLFSPNNSKRL